MKYKVAPEPRSLAFLGDAQATLPLVPSPDQDCCARLMDGTDVAVREDAQEWITFLQALGLVTETDRGYKREGVDPDEADLGAAFRERVYAAADVLDALESVGPADADAVFEEVRDVVPQWERNRVPDWEAAWVGRVERLLEWAVRFDLVERDGDAYRSL
ncbi:hypothetical protein QA599_06210 [Haloarculaceae archaeon H-GB1-1]|nr:hypothetical protein [Haloarculaceae archaeon H-GB1-1]